MTRITRISRLRDCGIFRAFTWLSDLPEFGRYNLIYGWNGTGKTTLSRLLRNLELRRLPKKGEVALRINGRDVLGGNFAQSNYPIRVFNRDFIADNVFPVGGGEIPPIVVLGQENVEKQQKIEQLKRQHSDVQSELESARATRKTADKDFDRFCIEQAKQIKQALRSSGPNQYNQYNNYDKSNFQHDSEQVADTGTKAVYSLDDEERKTLGARLHAALKPKQDEITYALPDVNAIADRISKRLNTTVVSVAIESLKNDPELAEWTREGLALHRGRSAELCQFCEQPLPKKRLVDLESHFSDQYERFIQCVNQDIDELKTLSQEAEKLNRLHKAAFYDDLGAEFESSEAALEEALMSTQDFLSFAIQALEDKKNRVFEQVKLEVDPPEMDTLAVEKLNKIIEKHNQACDDFETRTNEARQQLAKNMIAEGLEEFLARRDAAEDAKASVQANEQEIQRLDDEIIKLERGIVEHLRPGEELTEDLRNYLGHGELCLEIKDTGYTITRDGVPAKSLSEGETTAIALLYFLKSLQDMRFDMESGIIVLDDPVSSLDANALFLAFGFIYDRTKDAGQLFVLTHNFSFFRQVRNWFCHLNPARFFMLDTMPDAGVRSSTIRQLDPLLKDYESEYQYLFARVYSASNDSGSDGLEHNYVLPNMARRLLETFLAFRQPQREDLRIKLEKVQFDHAKKRRILRFLHTHSHSIALGEPEHDLTALAEGPSVLKDLLDMIESLDDEHYRAMVDLVSPSTGSGGAQARS